MSITSLAVELLSGGSKRATHRHNYKRPTAAKSYEKNKFRVGHCANKRERVEARESEVMHK